MHHAACIIHAGSLGGAAFARCAHVVGVRGANDMVAAHVRICPCARVGYQFCYCGLAVMGA
eukprot:13015519-Alexandrium_andersonii.AAC.1